MHLFPPGHHHGHLHGGMGGTGGVGGGGGHGGGFDRDDPTGITTAANMVRNNINEYTKKHLFSLSLTANEYIIQRDKEE